MTCREKGGSQTAFLKDVRNRVVVGLQNVFLGKCFSDLPRTEVGMLEFIPDHFVLVFLCKSLGGRVDSMGSVREAFHVSVAFSKSLEVTVDVTECEVCFCTNLLRCFLMLQDRTYQLITLICVHSVAPRIWMCISYLWYQPCIVLAVIIGVTEL